MNGEMKRFVTRCGIAAVVAGAMVSAAAVAHAGTPTLGPEVDAVSPTTFYPSGKTTIDVKCHSSSSSTGACRGHLVITMAEGPQHVQTVLAYAFFSINPEQKVTLNLTLTAAGKQGAKNLIALGPGLHKGTCPVIATARQGRSRKRTTISQVGDLVEATG